MKAFRIIPVFAVFILLAASCQPVATTSPPPTATPSFPTTTPLPTEEPASPATSPMPPAQPTIGSTWTRPADGMVMVYVPAGEFQMGSTEAQIETAIALCREHYSPCNNWYYGREGPAHAVSIGGFWIDQAEVTNAQYRRCVEGGVCSEPLTCRKREPTYADPEKADHPVVCVSWDDAQAYCEWAGARLPTEAEWEYAFRGQQGSIYPWGDSFDGSRLNYCDTNCLESHADNQYDDGYPNTAPVASFPQDVSWSGATGMSGNVSEWVADWFGVYSTEALSNPTGPESGNEKMLKECSWFSPPAYCRGAARASVDPGARYDYLGFRCAGSPDGMAIAVPQGLPPAIDGIIALDEWESARRELFTDGSELFLMR
jgi:formylglycine-generating enzyme required for sulfatase activity